MIVISMVLISLWPAPNLGGDAARVQEPGGYLSYMGIKQELERVSAEHPDIISLTVLGTTWEGRDIMALRLTDHPEDDEGEPAILIMGGHHGNELASVEVPMHILNFLVENYADNSTVRNLVDNRDIWFVPLVNPDGREYALNHDTSWRKNRRPVDADGDGTVDGVGVDPNRNYGHLWGQQGTSHVPSSSIYCGPEAFSENETRAVRSLAMAMNFSVSLSYHTYGEVIYYPWNNGLDTVSPRGDVLEAVARDMADMIGYTPMEGKAAYLTTGDSDDWLYSSTHCLPFTVELGTQFVTPPEQLEALCARNLGAAIHAMELAREPERALLPDWTFMVYMSADADVGLANEALIDLNEMEVAGSTPEVNIIVLYDGRATGDSSVYRIERDPGGFNTAIISPTVDDGGAIIPPTGELAMSDPEVLRNFVSWTLDNYPAQKYLLGFWGHGDGVLRTFVPDSGSGMSLVQVGPALAGFKLDIVGFDTCSLGHFEVASHLYPVADIMIGSQAEEPLAGWNYAVSLEKLLARPRMSSRELATIIVSDYLASRTEGYITQAAVDVAAVHHRLIPALADLVNVSSDFAHMDHGNYWLARNLTSTFIPRQDAVDLFEFLDRLKGRNVSGPVMDRLDRVLELREELVIHSGTGPLHPEATTMAVYFPRLEDPVSGYYSNYLAFLESGWDRHLALMKQPQPRPVMTHIPGIAADSSAGPYNVTASIENPGQGPFLLFYREFPRAWQSIPMAREGNVLSGAIPGQADGALIEYYLKDTASDITEPYEIKWGSRVYFNFTVVASCDVSLTWAETPPLTVAAGNLTVLRLNCSNAGPEPVSATVVMTLNGTANNVILGIRELELGPGEHAQLEFNWTPTVGTWMLAARASPGTVRDTNVSNQSVMAWVNVTGRAGSAGNGLIIVLLVTVWTVPAALAIHILRKARRRRRESAARALNAARAFLETAREFGGDITEASILLARAEAALASGALPECEKLVSRARESAMNSVGERAPAGEKQGGAVP